MAERIVIDRKSGQPYLYIKAKNGEVTFVSEHYDSVSNARRAARSFAQYYTKKGEPIPIDDQTLDED